MKSLQDLTGELRKLEVERGFERNRTLARYNDTLGFNGLRTDSPFYGKKGLHKIILDHLGKKSEVVWVDLGCGNGVALREGKRFLEEQGINPARLRTYGIDALPVREDEIEEYIQLFPDNYSTPILDTLYRPHFIQEDIHTITFPEKPDLITAAYVLPWTDDPLKVIANALSQAKIGATFFADGGEYFIFSQGSDSTLESDSTLVSHPLFQEIVRRDKGISIKPFLKSANDLLKSGLMIEKINEMDDFTYGITLLDQMRLSRYGPSFRIYRDENHEVIT